MRESSVYQMIIERGIEQGIEQGRQLGAKESTIAHILALLDVRFDVSTAPDLTSLLEAIDDLQQLRCLFDEALAVEHLEHFIHALQTARHGT